MKCRCASTLSDHRCVCHTLQLRTALHGSTWLFINHYGQMNLPLTRYCLRKVEDMSTMCVVP